MTTRVTPWVCQFCVVWGMMGGELTSVISFCWPSSLEPHFCAFRKFAAIGPRQMPMSMAGTESASLVAATMLRKRTKTYGPRRDTRHS